MLDNFRFKTDPEILKMLSDFWEDLEYLVKIRILLRAYPGYSITKLESRGIGKMWKEIPLERKKEIYSDQWKYQK